MNANRSYSSGNPTKILHPYELSGLNFHESRVIGTSCFPQVKNNSAITKGISFVIFALFFTVSAYSQFTIDGQYRARGELRNGFKRPILDDEKPAIFIEHRARLSTGYKKEKIGFRFSLQDIRIWGETGQINKSDQLLSIHEAYGDYYLNEKTTFRIGRQEIAYDEHRFFGTLDWAMQARSFDAVRYIFKSEKSQLDFTASWNQEGYGDGFPEPTKLTGNNYTITTGGGTNSRIFNLSLPKSQLMAYYKKTFTKGSAAIMLLNDYYNSNDSTTETHSDFTIGFTPIYSLDKLEIGGQFYYTGGAAGKYYDGTDYKKISLSGFMFNAYIKLKSIKGSPLLGIDYLTGDEAATTNKVEGWSPKYGTNHKFYGNMDYFYVGNPHGGVDSRSAGLMDIYLKTNFKMNEKFKIIGDVHYFSSTAERTNNLTGETFKGGLGTELDLVAIYNITPEINLQAGYSHMLGITDTMKQLKLGNPAIDLPGTQNWTWIMITFSPKFL